jgi:hypothetical protein
MPDATRKPSLEPRHIRSLALAGAVVGVVLLPIAAAQANPTTPTAPTSAGQASAQPTATPTAAQPVAGEFCGKAGSLGAGAAAVQAQSCVEQQDGTAWAQVYVANGGAAEQTVTLNLTRTDGTVIQVQCTVAAADLNGVCQTGALPTTGGTGAYNAIAEVTTPGQPLSDGVLHVESGLVGPSDATNGSTVVTEQ